MFVVFFYGCSGFEFVYSVNPNIDNLKKKTVIKIIGDDRPIVLAKLGSKLGVAESNIFLLEAEITRTITPVTYEDDGTVSKQEIKHSAVYALSNIENDCLIIKKSISNQSNYNKASASTSFGSDFSESVILEKNIEENIEQFFDAIASRAKKLQCD